MVSSYAYYIRYFSFLVRILSGRRGGDAPMADIYRLHGINGNLHVNYDKHILSIGGIDLAI